MAQRIGTLNAHAQVQTRPGGFFHIKSKSNSDKWQKTFQARFTTKTFTEGANIAQEE